MEPKITVEVWSDIVCPWCWIARRRFETALSASSRRDRFKVVHRAFRLSPGGYVVPSVEMTSKKFHLSEAQAIQRIREFEANAVTDGLDFRMQDTLFGDSIDSHRIALWSEGTGLQSEVIERLFKAYFSDGVSIFDRGNLVSLVTEVGLDPGDAAEMLESESFKKEVFENEKRAGALGARGVPYFLVGEKNGLSGAQTTETFSRLIEKT
ncbi:MAG TPA: DsbA family oxidoreductase, partial [Chthoniobacterales bacterium]